MSGGASLLFFPGSADLWCPRAVANVGAHGRGYVAVWGAIYELADDEESGAIRPGQLMPITRLDQVLGNDPFITLQIVHFVKTAVALAVPFAPELAAGWDFDCYLRAWADFRRS